MNKIKKILCSFLAVCIISTTLAQPVQAFTGAEGAILGGGGALASISLSAPQVALLLAAGFGLVVAVENADKLAEGMTTALNTAAAGVDAGAETLSQWLENAKKGSIAISTAPIWIAGAIKSWISGLYDTVSTSVPIANVSACQLVPAGTIVPAVDFWGSSSISFDKDVILIRFGDSVYDSSSGTYSVTVKTFAYAVNTGGFKYKTYSNGVASGSGDHYASVTFWEGGNPVNVFYREWTYGSNPSPDSSLDYDKNAIKYAGLLPSYSTFKASGARYAKEPYGPYCAYVDGIIVPSGSVCPDKTVGGIGAALEDGKSIDDVNIPDMNISGSKSICPDGVLDGSIPIADTVADVIAGLTDGSISWTDYVGDVAGTPTITVPVEGEATGSLDYPITDTGVSDTPIEVTPDQPGEVEVPEGLAPYTVELKDFFPFCIPFDIVDFVGVLCADPVAPAFEWTFTQYSGQQDTLEIDLSPFDQVAQLLRNMELLLFIIGLAFLTRNLIRG